MGAHAIIRLEHVTKRFALAGFEGYHPYQLSGGMRKRASLATTLAYEPDIILMDEPFSALDVQTRNLMENELLEIRAQEKKTVLAMVLAGGQVAGAAEREKVDFGVGSAPGASVYIQVDLARALGYFAEEGLDLNLQHFKGGAVAGAALVGGSIEISANAIDHVIKAKQQGKELRMIVSFTHLPGTPLVVNTKYRNGIKSPKDLRGRPVGVTAPGSATDLLMRYMVKRGKGYLLVDLRTEKDTRAIFGGPYQFTGLLTRAEVIERRPGMIQKVVNALVKANRWMAANPVEKWADTMPAELVGDRATWIESFKASKETFTADSLPTREAVMSVLRTFEAVGQIPNATKMDPDGLIDTRFVKKALERK